jgi:hypothetical protein
MQFLLLDSVFFTNFDDFCQEKYWKASNPSLSSAERFGGGVTQGFSPDSSALKG